ncbi:organic hydroperoxide resistance protein [Labrys okinawensis]|uniref:organic hydroperoxide resistance protein n=1 Tax=Labrys okinawensis TaxID=346911 RepID=UPI0039BC2488
MKVLYTTAAKSDSHGRDGGHAGTLDGNFSVTLSLPKELGGSGNPGTNPEQLFATGYSACFMGALRFVAGKEKVTLPADASVTATVGIGPRDDGTGFSLDVALAVALPGIDKATADDLVAKAHVVCPYSEATRKNLDVRLSVV